MPADIVKIAATLVGGIPLSCKQYPDGSLVVIAPSGKKCYFSAEEVKIVLPEPKVSRPSRPSKARSQPAVKNSEAIMPKPKPSVKTTPPKASDSPSKP